MWFIHSLLWFWDIGKVRFKTVCSHFIICQGEEHKKAFQMFGDYFFQNWQVSWDFRSCHSNIFEKLATTVKEMALMSRLRQRFWLYLNSNNHTEWYETPLCETPFLLLNETSTSPYCFWNNEIFLTDCKYVKIKRSLLRVSFLYLKFHL